MKTPTLEEINKASHEQLCRWWRFLPSDHFPQGLGGKRIKERLFDEFDGITPEMSKKIGWGRR